MTTRLSRVLLLSAAAVLLPPFGVAPAPVLGRPAEPTFQETFPIEKEDLATVGRNPYFVLEPGYQLTLDGPEGKKKVHLVITVTDRTETVDGIDTRVVEERESADGRLTEVSRNFFAISTKTHEVFYFGEEVDIYRNGGVVGSEGAWRAGKDGARFGLMLPGTASVGGSYYQEHAPGVAMDRARIVSASATLRTPAGKFDHCLKVEETTPLEPGDKEYKVYAPGVGLIADGSLLLTRVERASKGE